MIWAAAPSTRSSLPATTDQLSPYIDTLRLEVSASLSALLGLADPAGLSWESRIGDRARGTGDVRVRLQTGDGELEVTLVVRRAGDAFTLTPQRARVPYRKLDARALQTDLRLERRVSQALDRAGLAVRERVVEALHAWWRHDGVGDWMYRQVAAPSDPGATLRLGFRCNQRCGFCWQGRSWPDPPEALLRRWIDEVAALGLTSITFSGGEPTLHPALAELVAHAAKDHGLRVVLQTNALRLRDPATLDALLAAGLESLLVSYHSADSAISDAMTRAPGTHVRTRAGIEACLRRAVAGRPEVRLNCLVESTNVAGLPDLARDVVDRFVRPFPGAGVRSVEFSYPNLSYDRERFQAVVVPLDVVRAPLIEAARLLRAAGVEVILFSGCGFPACAVHGAPELQGTVNLRDLDTKDVEGRRWGEACAACALQADCLGLRREYLEVHGARGIVPLPTRPTGEGR